MSNADARTNARPKAARLAEELEAARTAMSDFETALAAVEGDKAQLHAEVQALMDEMRLLQRDNERKDQALKSSPGPPMLDSRGSGSGKSSKSMASQHTPCPPYTNPPPVITACGVSLLPTEFTPLRVFVFTQPPPPPRRLCSELDDPLGRTPMEAVADFEPEGAFASPLPASLRRAPSPPVCRLLQPNTTCRRDALFRPSLPFPSHALSCSSASSPFLHISLKKNFPSPFLLTPLIFFSSPPLSFSSDPKEIPFVGGDTVYVFVKKPSPEGWWYAECRGKVGLVPKSFLVRQLATRRACALTHILP
eukprot:scaffold4131_cov83-Isochrysis_galbana.AAC.1